MVTNIEEKIMLIPFGKICDISHGKKIRKHLDNPMSIPVIFHRWIRENKDDFRYNNHYMTCWKNKIVTSGGAYKRGDIQPDEYIEANNIVHKAFDWIDERYDNTVSLEENRLMFRDIIKTFRANAIQNLQNKLATIAPSATVQQVNINNFQKLGLYVVSRNDIELFKGHYEEVTQYINEMGA